MDKVLLPPFILLLFHHLLLPGWGTWMDGWLGRMTGRMDGKDDHPRILYKWMRHNFPSHFYEVVGLRSILFFLQGDIDRCSRYSKGNSFKVHKIQNWYICLSVMLTSKVCPTLLLLLSHCSNVKQLSCANHLNSHPTNLQHNLGYATGH